MESVVRILCFLKDIMFITIRNDLERVKYRVIPFI